MQKFSISRNQLMENTQFWKENSEADYVRCIQNIIRSKPFGENKFYIFSFVKRVDDITGVKKMYHHPRLTKPEPVPGSTLMRVDPNNPEQAKIIWTLPNQENFALYKHGKMFADEFVYQCIETFCTCPESFLCHEEGDLTDDQIREVYQGKRRK